MIIGPLNQVQYKELVQDVWDSQKNACTHICFVTIVYGENSFWPNGHHMTCNSSCNHYTKKPHSHCCFWEACGLSCNTSFLLKTCCLQSQAKITLMTSQTFETINNCSHMLNKLILMHKIGKSVHLPKLAYQHPHC